MELENSEMFWGSIAKYFHHCQSYSSTCGMCLLQLLFISVSWRRGVAHITETYVPFLLTSSPREHQSKRRWPNVWTWKETRVSLKFVLQIIQKVNTQISVFVRHIFSGYFISFWQLNYLPSFSRKRNLGSLVNLYLLDFWEKAAWPEWRFRFSQFPRTLERNNAIDQLKFWTRSWFCVESWTEVALVRSPSLPPFRPWHLTWKGRTVLMSSS